ncbi:DNA-directed RNA polymerase, delta subunit [Trichinella spiralis]|uniref:DNA-directed RNA polymerase, delta subunit n=1 Tax=Trichinella spiralis TaxID=6334 RepID=UPI0001EFCC55|nr:DNA-directed RNA polymerase, delta subunit [Trichinella spiralis]
MVIYPDADISEPDIDTDEDLAKELFDASDDDDIKKVQEVHSIISSLVGFDYNSAKCKVCKVRPLVDHIRV